jgi:hypothetical protein
MKMQFLMLSAITLLAYANASHAASRDVDSYLQSVNAAVQAKLEAAAVTSAQPLQVNVQVGGDGRIQNARVAPGTASLETDAKVHQALRRLTVAAPPAALAGRTVKLTIAAPIEQAKLP